MPNQVICKHIFDVKNVLIFIAHLFCAGKGRRFLRRLLQLKFAFLSRTVEKNNIMRLLCLPSHTEFELCKPKSAYLARPCHISLRPRTTSTLTQRNGVHATQSTPLRCVAVLADGMDELDKERRMTLYRTASTALCRIIVRYAATTLQVRALYGSSM